MSDELLSLALLSLFIFMCSDKLRGSYNLIFYGLPNDRGLADLLIFALAN